MLEYRRRLPHFQPDDAYLFVTWRLWGSLPANRQKATYPTPGHAFVADRFRGVLAVVERRLADETRVAAGAKLPTRRDLAHLTLGRALPVLPSRPFALYYPLILRALESPE
jgi:hypothetical protein